MKKLKELMIRKIITNKKIISGKKYFKNKLIDFGVLNLIYLTAVISLFVPFLLLFLSSSSSETVRIFVSSLTKKDLLIVLMSSPLVVSMHYLAQKISFKRVKKSSEKFADLIDRIKEVEYYNYFKYVEYYDIMELLEKTLSKEELEFFSKELSKSKTSEQIKKALNSCEVRNSIENNGFNVKYIWSIMDYFEKQENREAEQIKCKNKEKSQNLIFNLDSENKKITEKKPCFVS